MEWVYKNKVAHEIKATFRKVIKVKLLLLLDMKELGWYRTYEVIGPFSFDGSGIYTLFEPYY